MKIKSIDNFTLEECLEYLKQYPNGPESLAVEKRMNDILKQNMYSEEQEEKQKKVEHERLEQDVKWIDIKQFLTENKYKSLLGLKTILMVVLICYVYTHYYYHYHPITIPIPIILITLLLLCIINLYHSPSISSIYNIEQEEKIKSYRRTQNKRGMYGLHLCKKHKIVQILPFKYDNIYYCGGSAYICVKGNKRGVYNTERKKMVVSVEYDSIDVMQDGTLNAVRNGMLSRLTTEGYRIIE